MIYWGHHENIDINVPKCVPRIFLITWFQAKNIEDYSNKEGYLAPKTYY